MYKGYTNVESCEIARRLFYQTHGVEPEEITNAGWAIIAGPIPGITRTKPVPPKIEFISDEEVQRIIQSRQSARAKKLSRFRILERDHFRCVYCGVSSVGNETVKLHLDHIMPRSKGGKDIASNLATACGYCNIGKQAKLLDFETLKELRTEVDRRNLEAGIDGDNEVACFVYRKGGWLPLLAPKPE